LALLLVAWSVFGVRPRRRDAATTAYLQMCERLAAIGLLRRTGEGPIDYARRIGAARPDLQSDMESITGDYLALSFAPARAPQQSAIRLLRDRVRAFRPRARAMQQPR
jgi:hypothetical protein